MAENQLIRSSKILKDGRNLWYNVTETPSDLISYPQIKDWNSVSKEMVDNYSDLSEVLPRFNLLETSPNCPLMPGAILHKKKVKPIKKEKAKM